MHYFHYKRFVDYTNYVHYFHYLQVRVDLGIADYTWQDKRTAIAQTVDALADQFRPAMRSGWLSYISKTYPDGGTSAVQAVGQGPLVSLVVGDNE